MILIVLNFSTFFFLPMITLPGKGKHKQAHLLGTTQQLSLIIGSV